MDFNKTETKLKQFLNNGLLLLYQQVKQKYSRGIELWQNHKFVDNFLTKEGETVEEAKERLAAERNTREEANKPESDKSRS